jgi:hypothetical protein
MSRPTIKTAQVRARDLVEGDVIQYKDRPASRIAIWRTIKEIKTVPHSERIAVKFTTGVGTSWNDVDLVTVQIEIHPLGGVLTQVPQ